jgi:hypothetical protein
MPFAPVAPTHASPNGSEDVVHDASAAGGAIELSVGKRLAGGLGFGAEEFHGFAERKGVALLAGNPDNVLQSAESGVAEQTRIRLQVRGKPFDFSDAHLTGSLLIARMSEATSRRDDIVVLRLFCPK